MNLAWRFLGFASCIYMVGGAACGGKVRDDPGSGGNAGSDTMSSTTGIAGGGTGTTGSATTGVGGTTGIDPRVTCESVCQRILASGCSQMSPGDCIQSCESFRLQFPTCMSLYDDYLLCLETTPLMCGPGGSEPTAPQCDGIVQKLEDCLGTTPPPPPPPPPVFDAGAPGQCSGMVPPRPMSCFGGTGSAAAGSAATTTGGPSQPTCITQCTDRNNNTWESHCVGTTCSCTYNGVQYCSCVVAGPSCQQAPGCCPGAP